MRQESNNKLYLVFIILFLIVNITLVVKIWLTMPYFNKSETMKIDKMKFDSYLAKFNKSYYGDEYNRRLKNFKASLAEIARLNRLEGATVFGLTQFADMSEEEFLRKRASKIMTKCGYHKHECKHPVDTPSTRGNSVNSSIPLSFDWRKEGYVSPILDQGSCFACWAMSVIGIMETMAAKRGVFRQPLSVQEVIDCSKYTNRCANGSVNLAFEYLCRNKTPVVSASQYPLTLKDTDCQENLLGRGVKVKCYDCYNNIDEEEILHFISHHGPVTTVLDPRPLRLYISGIIQWSCPKVDYERHALHIIGYDRTAAIPHYILKNSWGVMYGDHGYIKVAIGRNVCGIADQIITMEVETEMS